MDGTEVAMPEVSLHSRFCYDHVFDLKQIQTRVTRKLLGSVRMAKLNPKCHFKAMLRYLSSSFYTKQ